MADAAAPREPIRHRRRPSFWQRTGHRLALLAVVISALGLACRYWRGNSLFELGLIAGAPYLMAAAPAGLLGAVVARRWALAALLAALSVLCASTQSALYTVAEPPPSSTSLHVMTLNSYRGNADAGQIVELVRAHRVDFLVVNELTPILRQELADAGIDDALPFHAASLTSHYTIGTGLWSRTPLEATDDVGGFAGEFVSARISLGGGQPDLRVAGLHLDGPSHSVEGWKRDAQQLPDALVRITSGGPTIVAGDFNATADNPWFRDALNEGYVSAADQAGAGLLPTWPADTVTPPMLGIDHVLTKNGPIATKVMRVRVSGTDHLGVVAYISLPERASRDLRQGA